MSPPGPAPRSGDGAEERAAPRERGERGGARRSSAPAGRVAAAEAPPCLGRPPGEGGVRFPEQPGLGQVRRCYSRGRVPPPSWRKAARRSPAPGAGGRQGAGGSGPPAEGRWV